jgi:hypothetical protein
MGKKIAILAALAAIAVAGSVAANDSVAEMVAGGLVLKQSRDIDMVSEDLYVSPRQIRVRYVFRNRSSRDIRTTVAFPMPDRDLAEMQEGDRAFPTAFRTIVDGRQVRTQTERRATLRGVDHSALLRQLGIPLTAEGNAAATIMTHLDRLPSAQQQRLQRLGLIEATEFDDTGRGMQRHWLPRWTAHETWYWEQVFPAGRDLNVEHSYAPGTGATVSTALHEREFRQSAEGRRQIARYCIDRDFLASLDRMAARAGRPEQAMLPELRVGYILRTGANWRSPIGSFRLVVDKEAAGNIVSFCGTGLRRISPTQFEMRRTNWRPTEDLNVLIVQPR